MFPIVGVGASAGGLEAFSQLLSHLPLDTGMGFVLVQHLDPHHESALKQLLARATSLQVHEVTNNLRVEANHVYVIPPNTNLSIAGGVLTLRPRSQTRTPHRSIDFFFEALADDQCARAIGVILSGTASDGTLGLEAIKAKGGITFAQDDSARYESMPRSAVAAGCVDFVLSPEHIAKELARIAAHPSVAGATFDRLTPAEDDRTSATAHEDDDTPLPSGGHGTPRTGAKQARAEAQRGRVTRVGPRGRKDGFKDILLLLRNHSGVDFSRYKSNTIQRRITRRMVLTTHNTLELYAQFLRGNAKELDALYSDTLISVTSFFRNPDAFDVLQRNVLPRLLRKRGDEPLRVWVPGCSTGQEAYSIAMAFVEAAEKAPSMRKLQVFATDLNDALLDKARHGLYAKSLAQDISPERLRRFFIEEEGGYRIIRLLREMVIFARQNLISDPPFSRMDLISCRNLLIYLEPDLQKQVFPLFHYALRPDGFLYLGASESIGNFTELFEPLDKKHKIYAKKAAATPPQQLPGRKERREQTSPGHFRMPAARLAVRPGHGEPAEGFRAELTAEREADRVAIVQFAPPGVLINAELQILQFRGPTSPYLEPPTGKASFDVLKMARQGLLLPLRTAIDKAKQENKTARTENLRVEADGKTRTVNLEVIPLKNLQKRCFLIVFEDAEKAGRAKLAPRSAHGTRRPVSEESLRIAELESDLAETRDYLQSMQELHEGAREELQASNEEVQSANEELQSINEELETSKEELESGNEELTTVNEELGSRHAELTRLTNDLVNLQTSAHLSIVLLGRDLTIRRFSALAEKQFNLLAADVGRPITKVRHNLNIADLEELVTDAIETVCAREREVQDQDGRWYSLRVRPYLTLDNRVDGAVLVLMDIGDLKRAEQAVAAARDYAENIVETVREPLLVLDSQLCVESANRSFYRLFSIAPAQTVGRLIFDLDNHQWDIPELRTLLEQMLPQNTMVEDFHVEHHNGQLGLRSLLLNARRIFEQERKSERILLAIEDITERKRAEETLRASDRHKNEFLAMLAHELRNPLAPISNALEIIRRARGGESSSSQMIAAPSHEPETPRLDVSYSVDSAVEMLDRQVGQMVRLVDDLLDAQRISGGKLELRRERVELSSVVRHAAQAARPLYKSMGHELTVTLPPEPIYVDADPIRLAQIVGNLLNNACKFTDRGGRIWLTVEHGDRGPRSIQSRVTAPFSGVEPSAPEESAADETGVASSRRPPDVVIRVRDTGIGITADQFPRIFEMFAQVDTSMERSVTGLGIGLTLVKTLVEMHGGTVEVRSTGPGQGSEFVVRLPNMAEAREPPPAPTTTVPTAATALRILVVDDNRDAAESLALLLKFSGHETHTAHDGLEAVEAAAKLQPDVILLDIGLPRLNGYEAARRIRQQRRDKGPVLVALTGWGQDEDRRRSDEAGFDAHLVKPVDYVALGKLLVELGAGSRELGN